MTPHNSAACGDIAETVLMPGDPMRARFIAEKYLKSPVLVNNVRGIQGYSGYWNGTAVTVMASGMGIPSIGIYSWELYNCYNVKSIIRVGTAGALSDELNVKDVILAMGACTDSNFVNQYKLPGTFAPIADFRLLNAAVTAAGSHGLNIKVGNVLSSDVFYTMMIRMIMICGRKWAYWRLKWKQPDYMQQLHAAAKRLWLSAQYRTTCIAAMS